MPSFEVDGQRLAYTVYGEGPRLTVLLHGLLFNQRMHEALARALAARGNRVVTLDLLGHGDSDRPRRQVALLDAGVRRARSSRCSTTSTSPRRSWSAPRWARTWRSRPRRPAPERLRGMVIEMPVLDHALIGCALGFTPIMVGLTAGAPAARALSRVARAIPRRRLPWQADILLDWIRQDPEPSAAVFQGLFFGRIAPPREERRELRTPALVIGHQYDLIHPFSDAGMLAAELPGARLLEASSLIELRVAPKRLTNEIAGFVDTCWKPRPAQFATTRVVSTQSAATLTRRMSSRQEEKERRKRERQEREAAEKAKGARRKRMQMVFGGGLVAVAVVAIVVVVVVVGLGGDDSPADEVPASQAGIPAQQEADLKKAAAAAGCKLVDAENEGAGHEEKDFKASDYKQNPPTSGAHFPTWYEDGIYNAGRHA